MEFWAQFVFRDFFCYFGLYLAEGSWKLRIASMKQMALVFLAFNRDYYAHILPYHLAEIQCSPPVVLTCLEKGGYTVNLPGQQW